MQQARQILRHGRFYGCSPRYGRLSDGHFAGRASLCLAHFHPVSGHRGGAGALFSERAHFRKGHVRPCALRGGRVYRGLVCAAGRRGRSGLLSGVGICLSGRLWLGIGRRVRNGGHGFYRASRGPERLPDCFQPALYAGDRACGLCAAGARTARSERG